MIDEKRMEKIKAALKSYPYFKFIGKGKRGEAYLISDDLIVKVENDSVRAPNCIKNEYNILKRLEGSRFFPKAVMYNDELKFVIREYVKGSTIDECRGKSCFIDSLKLARELDTKEVNQRELGNPYKHIFIDKGNAMMIDFERAKITQNPKNVTQFSQYLCKRLGIGYKKLLPFLVEYKKCNSENNFKKIIKVLKVLIQ